MAHHISKLKGLSTVSKVSMLGSTSNSRYTGGTGGGLTGGGSKHSTTVFQTSAATTSGSKAHFSTSGSDQLKPSQNLPAKISWLVEDETKRSKPRFAPGARELETCWASLGTKALDDACKIGLIPGKNSICPAGSKDVLREYKKTGKVPDGWTILYRGHPKGDPRFGEYLKTGNPRWLWYTGSPVNNNDYPIAPPGDLNYAAHMSVYFTRDRSYAEYSAGKDGEVLILLLPSSDLDQLSYYSFMEEMEKFYKRLYTDRNGIKDPINDVFRRADYTDAPVCWLSNERATKMSYQKLSDPRQNGLVHIITDKYGRERVHVGGKDPAEALKGTKNRLASQVIFGFKAMDTFQKTAIRIVYKVPSGSK